jgi:thiamine-phosphate pyrophosphorylase
MERKIYRIIDADFNRAREALRTIEEFCRFVLDDSGLSARAKQMRHDLCAQIARLDMDTLLAQRDSRTDVGRTLQIESPQQRRTLADTCIAAAKRCSEALRVLAEMAQIACPDIASPLEQIRFEVYTLEKDILSRLPAVRFRDVRLYILIPAGKGMPESRTLELAELCIQGGADALQLRAEEMTDARLFHLAERFAALCRSNRCISIINDRADIAAAAEADGVHLGADDLPPRQARQLFLKPALIGLTAHNEEELQRAVAAGADYVGIGPCFASPTKPELTPAGLGYIRRALEILKDTSVGHVAIGGITLKNLTGLLQTGVRAVALSSAVCAAPDPLNACRQFKKLLNESRSDNR